MSSQAKVVFCRGVTVVCVLVLRDKPRSRGRVSRRASSCRYNHIGDTDAKAFIGQSQYISCCSEVLDSSMAASMTAQACHVQTRVFVCLYRLVLLRVNSTLRQADFRLAEELTFLSLLPEALTKAFSLQRGSSPPLVIIYLSSLKVRSCAASFVEGASCIRVGEIVHDAWATVLFFFLPWALDECWCHGFQSEGCFCVSSCVSWHYARAVDHSSLAKQSPRFRYWT